ncbi:MAG: carbohydrate kinase family protein [bacterium]|nr:carbohydrate kinase family protein [bacterium]
MTLDLAVLGNLLVDDIVYEDGRTRMAQPGGAVLYAALGARLWGVEVGIFSVVGDDYPTRMLDDLAARGIDLSGVRRLDRPGLRTWLLYEGRRRHVVHRLDGPTHAEVSPTAADLDAGPRARAYHLAPMPFDVQRELIEALAAHRGVSVSVDPYELLTATNLGTWKELLAGVDDFLLSEDEMLVPGGLDDPEPVLAELCSDRPHRIFYKRAARGGIAYDHETGSLLEWPARVGTVIDPTGAGDAFAGGVLAGRLLGDPLPRALERGVVSAAFALEGEGADGLLAATPDSARQRLRDEFGSPR